MKNVIYSKFGKHPKRVAELKKTFDFSGFLKLY